MDLILVGLDHKTAPVAFRERFYLADAALREALDSFRAKGLAEVVILSTCNRLEILGVTDNAETSADMIGTFLADSQAVPIEHLQPHLYILEGDKAAGHLMRVASGLESQILGETQILGQVAHALAQAHDAHSDGPILSRLFSAALHTGKRSRTETGISRHTLSVSHAAVLLIQKQIESHAQMKMAHPEPPPLPTPTAAASDFTRRQFLEIERNTPNPAPSPIEQGKGEINGDDQKFGVLNSIDGGRHSEHPIGYFKSSNPQTSSLRVLVVGAGQMAELAVKALKTTEHITDIRLINRTNAKAKRLAEELGVQALEWDDLQSELGRCDVVIAATSSSHPVIRAEHLTTVVLERHNHPLLLVDVGLPRNIAADVRDLAGVQLYDIDDLQHVVETHRHMRQSEIVPVEVIINEELDDFLKWLHSREVVPLIAELRLRAETLAQVEVEQALHRLPGINPHEQEIITQMAHRIVNKILHEPTINLKSRALNKDHYDYAHAVRELFALDEHKAAE